MSNINNYGFPFNSVQYDRKYNAEEWRTYFSHLLDNGIIGQVTNELQVKPQAVPNKSVMIDKGAVFINGAMRILDETINLDVSENTSGMDRIDRIVAQIDYNSREINFTVVQGTPGANPVPPSLTKSLDIWQLSLAQVYLANGYTTIVGDNITDERQDETVCGYFKYKSKPAWYPGGDIPMDVWKYVLFKQELSAQEISDIEANSSLMDIINNTTGALKSVVQQIQHNLDNAESSLQGNINQVQTNLDNVEASLQSDINVAQAKLATIETGAQVNPTASEILTTMKTVDGSGSGLDADKLDGAHKDTDGTLSGNSDNSIPTEKAVRTYVNSKPYGKYSQMSGGSKHSVHLDEYDAVISFSNEDHDDFNAINLASSYSRITIPSGVTLVRFYYYCELSCRDGRAKVGLYKNGSWITNMVSVEILQDATPDIEIKKLHFSLPISCSSGDYFELHFTTYQAYGVIDDGSIFGMEVLK